MESQSKKQQLNDLLFMFFGASATAFLICVSFDLEGSTGYVILLAVAGTLAGYGLREAVRRLSAN